MRTMQAAFHIATPMRLSRQNCNDYARMCRPRVRPRPSMPLCCAAATRVKSEHRELLSALQGVNRGLEMDADSDEETEAEERVEDAIETLEAGNLSVSPSTDPRRIGEWELVYTSSPLTRFTGGLTGMQKWLPGGLVGRIAMTADGDDATWVFRETVAFEFLGREFTTDLIVDGTVEAYTETREVWSPNRVRFYFFTLFGDSWKSLRAFANANTTFLDESVKISRGATGGVMVFVRPELAEQLD